MGDTSGDGFDVRRRGVARGVSERAQCESERGERTGVRFFFRCNVVYSPPGKQQAAARSVVASRAATREELSNLSSRNPHLFVSPGCA